MPGCDRENSAALAERLRAGIDRYRADKPEGMMPVSITLGVAVNDGETVAGVNTLV